MFRSVVLVLVLCAGCPKPSVFGPAPGGWQKVFAEQTQTIPPRTDWGSSIDILANVRVQVDYAIEPGKRVTYYFMTDEQYTRVVNSEQREPTQVGRDFIRKSADIMGQGTDVTTPLTPTRYVIVFRNLESTPVTVTMRANGG